MEREVQAVISQVQEARNRLQVLKRSAEIAQKSYDISLARFDNGDITSQELALGPGPPDCRQNCPPSTYLTKYSIFIIFWHYAKKTAQNRNQV